MPVVPAVNTRDPLKSAHWPTRLRNAIAGGAAYLVRHFNNSATEPALEYWQVDATGTAPILQGRYSSAGIIGIEHLKNGLTFRSPDASRLIAISNSGVAITAPSSTLTVNGQSLTAGVRVYNVLDHGIVTGTDNTHAAANTAALIALWVTVAATGNGGVIYFPPGRYPFNASTTLNHTVGSTVRGVGIQGAGQGSRIDLYGTTGPWWSFATSSTAGVQGGYLRGLRFQHMAIPTNGATVLLGHMPDFTMDNVFMTNAGSGLASLYCLDIAPTIATTNLWLQDCKLDTRNDTATLASGGLSPVNIRVLNGSGISCGGLFLRRTDLSGCQTRSIGLDFLNAGDWDTVEITDGSLIKDHSIGIRKVAGAGFVRNLLMTGGFIDGITEFDVLLQPPTSSACLTWIFNGVWMSGDGSHIHVDETGGGTMVGVTAMGCYLSTTTPADGNPSINIGAGVDRVFIIGNHVNAADVNVGGVYSVDIGGASGVLTDVVVNGNYIACGASADGALRVSTAVEPFAVVGNVYRGVTASVPADNGTSKRNDLNAFVA